MHLVTISVAIWLAVSSSKSEILENQNNELALGAIRRKLIELVIPVRNRRENEEGKRKNELEEGEEIDVVRSPKIFISEALPKQEDQLNFNIDELQPSAEILEERKKRSPVYGGAECYNCGAGGVPVGGVSTMEGGGRAGSWSQSSSSSSSGSFSNDYNGASKRGFGKK